MIIDLRSINNVSSGSRVTCEYFCLERFSNSNQLMLASPWRIGALGFLQGYVYGQRCCTVPRFIRLYGEQNSLKDSVSIHTT